MSGITSLASHLLKTPLDEKQRSIVEQISQAGTTLERLLGDLLDFAALKSGGIDIKANPINPSEMLKGLAQAFRVQAEAKSIDFSVRIDPSLDGTYVGDALRISQIVSNLLANAVKFTHQGRVDLEAHLGSVTPATDHSTLVVRVSDTGPGISLDAQDRIFEAFEQASDETGKRQGGVGLGLSICRALLDRMGGRITIESEPGRGCTFTAQLPLLPHIETAAPEAESDLGEARSALTGKRVLVIDDSAAHRTIISLMFDAFGASFIPAATGEEGIDCLGRGGVDIALVDLNLPDVDGVAVIKHISDMSEREPAFRIPVIAISADDSGLREADVRSAGACDLLLKPLSAHHLYQSMKSALSVDRQGLSSVDAPLSGKGKVEPT